MKKIIVFALLLMTATVSFGQQNRSTPALSKQDYLSKSKHQKTTAWILLGGGVFSTTLGSVRFNFAGSDGEVDNSTSAIFLVTGLAAIGTSIPFFIASSKNKLKILEIRCLIKMEISPQVCKTGFVYRPLPSLAISIHL